jgi:hypothetical protein
MSVDQFQCIRRSAASASCWCGWQACYGMPLSTTSTGGDKILCLGYGPPAERLPFAVGIATGSCDADILEKILGAE